MRLISTMLKYYLILCLSFFVTSCFKPDTPESNGEKPGKHSAIDVKTHELTISLKSLRANQRSDINSPNLHNVAELYAAKTSDVPVEGSGSVVKILADDNRGTRHQKFLVKMQSGQTLLFTHNIEIAPRIEDIKAGDTLSFRGEYVYNPKGGIVHWTHHDPQSMHYAGWIKHNGKLYE